MSEWISVKDRLPEKEVAVLTWRGFKAGEPAIEACKLYESPDFDDPYWYYAIDGELAEDVTHWMPLPDPPEALAAPPETKTL